jgi:anti-anti-sigma regulatory factor
MTEPFKFEIQRGMGELTVLFHGDIDAHSDTHFDDLVDQVSNKRVIMDFSKTGRINSMGAAILIRSIKSIKVEKQAAVSLQGLNKINTLLFKITGILQLATEECEPDMRLDPVTTAKLDLPPSLIF